MRDGENCVFITDHNKYGAKNQLLPVRSKRGKKVWDDRANQQIVAQVCEVVSAFECGRRDYAQMVRSNDVWRSTFDYALVLRYFAALLITLSTH